MILEQLNPARVALQVTALGGDGTPKADIVSGTVRVYHVNAAGATVVDLSPTPLVWVADTTWRYQWAPAALAAGQYVAEYTLRDATKTYVLAEDLVVRDMAQQATLVAVGGVVTTTAAAVEIIRKIEAGRWKIVANQMIFYDDDGSTPLLTCRLYDDAGIPSMDRVFERVPV